MKVILQRVKSSAVMIDGNEVRDIGQGLCVLVGFGTTDTEAQVEKLAKKP